MHATLCRVGWRPQPCRLPDIGSPLAHAPHRQPFHSGPRRRTSQQQQQPDVSRGETKQLPAGAPPPSPPPKSLPAPHPPRADPIPVANSLPLLPLWQRLGPLTRAADTYARAQRRRPYVTQLVSGLVIALCADLSVQRMNRERSDGYDPKRTVRSLVIGGISAVPSYKWFMFLSLHFNFASRALSLATKVLVNQICFTPVFNSYFFGMQALLSGETLAATWAHIRRTVPVSFVNSWKVWPAVQTFSFTYVPIEYRSVFSGVVAVGWQTYLQYLQRSVEFEEAAPMAAPAVAPVASMAAPMAPKTAPAAPRPVSVPVPVPVPAVVAAVAAATPAGQIVGQQAK